MPEETTNTVTEAGASEGDVASETEQKSVEESLSNSESSVSTEVESPEMEDSVAVDESATTEEPNIDDELARVVQEALSYRGTPVIVLKRESDYAQVAKATKDYKGEKPVIRVNKRQQVRALWRKG